MPTFIFTENTTGGDSSATDNIALEGRNPDTSRNNGAFRVSEWFADNNDFWNIVLKADLSAMPSSATITAIRIKLYQTEYISFGANRSIKARTCLRDWVQSEATWNIFSTGNSWATAGGAYNSADCDTNTSNQVDITTNSGNDGTYLTWTLSSAQIADAQTAYNASGDLNVIFSTITQTGEFFEVNFAASWGTDGTRPIIEVDYTASGGTHPTSGSLIADGASIAGSARNFTAHPASGVLNGAGAVVSGTSVTYTVHESDGDLTANGASLSGGANNFTVHGSSGDLATGGAELDGIAEHTEAGTHDTSGELFGSGAALEGVAELIAILKDNLFGGVAHFKKLSERSEKQRKLEAQERIEASIANEQYEVIQIPQEVKEIISNVAKIDNEKKQRAQLKAQLNALEIQFKQEYMDALKTEMIRTYLIVEQERQEEEETIAMMMMALV